MIIDGQYRLTVRELLEDLSQENPDAVVVVTGSIAGKYYSTSVYKTTATAEPTDDPLVFLYMNGDQFPKEERCQK